MSNQSAARFPWSFSRLNLWRTCPRWFGEVHVRKTVVEPPSEATDFGSRVHEHIANRITSVAPWPDECAKFADTVDLLVETIGASGERYVEHKLALDTERKPCDWMADKVWVRSVLDLLYVHGDRAIVLDWKTGKRPAEPSDQLKLFALVVFAAFPEVETVSTAFIWLRSSPICATREVYHRHQADAMWVEFMLQTEQLDDAVRRNEFFPRPSGLCRRWCPVVTCEFNGSR